MAKLFELYNNLLSESIKYPDWITANPKVEINGNNITLYHYGTDSGTGYLEPKFFGGHSYTSDVKQWDQPRVFFYVSKEDKEPRVSGDLFIVHYPLNKLYPFNSDPLYFYEECQKKFNRKSLDVALQLSCIGSKAAEAGYSGFILKWNNSLRVDIWTPVKIA